MKDTRVTEGDSGVRSARFSVTRAGAALRPVTVHYSARVPSRLAKGRSSASSGSDFSTKRGVLRLRRGQRTGAISVPVKGDALDEPDETFALVLSAPRNARLSDGQALATIVDNDSPPSLEVQDTSVAEGSSGSAHAVFRIQLSEASGKTVTVDYTAKSGTANVGNDFDTTSGTARFAAGATTVEVAVPVRADTLDEPDERFFLVLANAQSASIRDSTAEAAIGDDDEPPALSVNDVGVSEGNTGVKSLIFTISLSAASGRSVSVAYTSSDGTATQPSDYSAASGTLSFSPGQTGRTVAVSVRGDANFETDESLVLGLFAPANATLADASGGGGIVNDDAPPMLTIDDVSTAEGNAGAKTITFTVRKLGASDLTATVGYSTSNGTAAAPGDYASTSGTLTFGPAETTKTFGVSVAGDSVYELAAAGTLTFLEGEAAKTVDVAVNGDTLDEPDETFDLTLSNAANAEIADGVGAGTITDDDEPTLWIDDSSVAEGNSGATNAIFIVRLSAQSSKTVSVAYASANGTATAPDDYASASGQLIFAPGQSWKKIQLAAAGDTAVEPDETLALNLTGAVNASVADAHAVGTIKDDDGPPGSALPAPLGQSTGSAFYVSTLGDDASAGTQVAPWRTIRKAVNTLRPGEQAYVRAGVYEENVLYDPTAGRGLDGTAAAPITIRNYPGEQPVLRPAQLNPSYPLRLKGSYFRFQGFVVEGSTLANTVNVYITDQGSNGGAHHIELSDCEVRGAERSSGIFVHWRDVHHIQLLRNRVHDNNEPGVQHQGIYLESSDSVIADNVTYNHTQGFGIQVRSDNALGPSNVMVANNTTAHNALGGVAVEHTASDVKMVNNISAFNGTGILGYFSPEHPDDPIGGGNEAWNNLLFGNGTDIFNSLGPEGTKPVVNFHDNFTGLNPLFVDGAGANYRLAAASPAIGRAVPAWSTPVDADARLRDPDPDLGAYERN